MTIYRTVVAKTTLDNHDLGELVYAASRLLPDWDVTCERIERRGEIVLIQVVCERDSGAEPRDLAHEQPTDALIDAFAAQGVTFDVFRTGADEFSMVKFAAEACGMAVAEFAKAGC